MQSRHKMQYKLADLINGLDVTIKGDSNCIISGVCTIQESQPGYITFLTNPHYRKHLSTTQASAVILTEEDAKDCPEHLNVIIARNPHFIYSKIAAFFEHPVAKISGIHPSVIIDSEADIHPTASIGPYCVIGKGVKIAANVVINASCSIGDFSEIGEDSQLDAHVTMYHHVKIGKRARISSGVVLGGEGFGFANQQGKWHKVPQLGTVIIGDDVDIGANTTIDRGAIDDTVIEDGVKLDNLIQIGHNVRIGANTIIAGCAGIAGSTVIGKNCMIGGAACITGHITICDNTIVTGMTGVSKSIKEPGMYASGVIGALPYQEFARNNARFYRLESLMERVKTLEATLKELTDGNDS